LRSIDHTNIADVCHQGTKHADNPLSEGLIADRLADKISSDEPFKSSGRDGVAPRDGP
jgi:hypothetical protein